MPHTDDLPVDLLTHRFRARDSWFVSGYPDNEAQWEESRYRRKGIGTQASWDQFRETVRFSETNPDNKAYPDDHPLANARVVEPKIRNGERFYDVGAHPCYDLTRRVLISLKERGMNVSLGANKSDFIEAAERTFAKGGLLFIATHYESDRGLEFNDGFLSFTEIAQLREPKGRGLAFTQACETADELRAFKFSLGSAVNAWGPEHELNTKTTLFLMITIAMELLEADRTFFELETAITRELESLGLENGLGDWIVNHQGA